MSEHLPENWTLTCGGVTRAAEEIGVTDLVRRRVSGGVDVCNVHVEGRAVGEGTAFAPGAFVQIARNGVTWFAGRVTGVPASGGKGEEGRVYRLSGPWWFLEQLVACQEWSVRGGAGSAWTSRLILGQTEDGSRLSTGEVIAQMLQDAISAGAPLQIGTIDPALYTPLDEVREVTCAEVIRALLRWHPDCAAWFDYAAAPVPTWHCRRRAALPEVTLLVGSAPVAEIRGITARPDLTAPAVVLHYEVNVELEGGGTALDVVTDAAPAGATGREFGAVVGTIPLRTMGAAVTDAAAAVAAVRSALPGTGLAAGFLEALAAVPYGGSVVLVEGAGELGATGAGLGCVVNLAGVGAAADWATMRALVVAEEVRVAAGTTVLRFGLPEGAGEDAEGGVRRFLGVTRAGVEGREAGSPGLAGTALSRAQVSGRMPPAF